MGISRCSTLSPRAEEEQRVANFANAKFRRRCSRRRSLGIKNGLRRDPGTIELMGFEHVLAEASVRNVGNARSRRYCQHGDVQQLKNKGMHVAMMLAHTTLHDLDARAHAPKKVAARKILQHSVPARSIIIRAPPKAGEDGPLCPCHRSCVFHGMQWVEIRTKQRLCTEIISKTARIRMPHGKYILSSFLQCIIIGRTRISCRAGRESTRS